MARKPPSGNGSSTNRFPGAYAHVLQKRCEMEAHMAISAVSNYLLLADDEVPAWERAKAERAAALVRERTGRPVNAMSHDLPRGLPSPFENYPVGGQRSFRVLPTDEIRLVPRQSSSRSA
jgi:hypothetical protein